MNGNACVGLGTVAGSRRCVEMSEIEPIGCCSGALLLSADHLHSPAYLHLHSPAAYPRQHSAIGFLSPFSRQLPGLHILDCLLYPLHDSHIQSIGHTVDLAMLS